MDQITHPTTPPPCRRVDEVLERVLADSQARMQRENDSVHMQRVATEVRLFGLIRQQRAHRVCRFPSP